MDKFAEGFFKSALKTQVIRRTLQRGIKARGGDVTKGMGVFEGGKQFARQHVKGPERAQAFGKLISKAKAEAGIKLGSRKDAIEMLLEYEDKHDVEFPAEYWINLKSKATAKKRLAKYQKKARAGIKVAATFTEKEVLERYRKGAKSHSPYMKAGKIPDPAQEPLIEGPLAPSMELPPIGQPDGVK